MIPPLTVSIVIVSYNIKELLRECLTSVRKYCTDVISEIFVVDNASIDGTISMLKESFPDVHVIANQSNVGFPAANNQAFKLAKGKYIFMLNPDTLFTDNALKKMIDYMDMHPEASLLAPCLLNPDGTIQKSIQPFISMNEIIAETFYLHKFVKAGKSYFRNKITHPIVVEALSGAAILFRKELIEQIGALDEELFWTEDMEFCYRAYKKGLNAVYFPEAKIIHHIGASGKKNLNVMISNQVLTKINFFKKNHSRAEYIIVLASRFLHIISRLIILSIVSVFSKKYLLKAKAYAFTLKRLVASSY
jgi:GT2 family glycosyltransferase